MSAEAVTWAYKVTVVREHPTDPKLHEKLKMGPKFLLVTLANYADEEHSAFPSLNTLAERMSCSRQAVIDSVKKLEELGLVIIKKRRRDNLSHTSSRYFMPVGSWAPFIVDASDEAADPSQESGLGVGAEPVDNFSDPSQESGLAQSRILTPLNRHPNQRISTGQVSQVTTDGAVDKSATGPKPSPATFSKTHGHPFLPADVFAALGEWLPTSFDDDQLRQLAKEILDAASSPVVDPTAYVIKTIRNTVKPGERRRGRWLLRADEIAIEHLELGLREGARF